MWREHNDTASHGVGHGVYYTASRASFIQGEHRQENHSTVAASTVYAISMEWPPGNELTLQTPKPSDHTSVEMLGCKKRITWRPSEVKNDSAGAQPLESTLPSGIVISMPALSPPELPTATGPWVFKLTSVF